MNNERDTFQMLWSMFDEAREADSPGQVISRYARIVDDRINNSGNSRSVTSLKLYSYEQLKDELDDRDSDD